MKLPHRLRRLTGSNAETQVAQYLAAQGLVIVSRNYHSRLGEIDLIARDGQTLVFIEVRMRRSASHGLAVETVTAAKQKRIIQCARHFLIKNPGLARLPCRFDVVGVMPADNDQGVAFQWLQDAFQQFG